MSRGLDKLRAAKLAPEPAPARWTPGMGGRELTKLSLLRGLMREGSWDKAIKLAAGWADLGDEAAAIARGREALLRPAFQRQLGRDPAVMLEEAKAALLARWPL